MYNLKAKLFGGWKETCHSINVGPSCAQRTSKSGTFLQRRAEAKFGHVSKALTCYTKYCKAYMWAANSEYETCMEESDIIGNMTAAHITYLQWVKYFERLLNIEDREPVIVAFGREKGINVLAIK